MCIPRLKSRKEGGQGLVEYAMILILAVIILVIIVTVLGPQVRFFYVKIIGGLGGQTINGTGTEAYIIGYDVAASGGPGTCSVAVTNIQVFGIEDGNLASGLTLNGTISASGGSSESTSGETNDDGIAMMSDETISGADCSGTATVSVAGNSLSFDY